MQKNPSKESITSSISRRNIRYVTNSPPWSLWHTGIGILFALLVVLFHTFLFFEFRMPLPILISGLLIVSYFFVALYSYINMWYEKDIRLRTLLFHSAYHRLLGVCGMYLLTYFFDPANIPLELSASDSWNYHYSGILVSDALLNGDSIFETLDTFWKSKSDFGFSILIGTLYAIFGENPLVPKLFNVLISSITVVQFYSISKYVFGEKQAKIAAILLMLMPPLLWFCGMLLKETLLIFLITQIAYSIIRILRFPKERWIYIVVILGALATLLFLRTVLVPILVVCIYMQLTIYKYQQRSFRLIHQFFGISLLIGFFYLLQGLDMWKELQSYWEASSSQFENELSTAATNKGIRYSITLIGPLLFIGAVITPFPSLLDFEIGQLGIFAHFQNEIIRNSMYFFVFAGIYQTYKNKNSKALFISAFAFCYMLVLAISGISFQDRFQVIALPFLLVFMAVGVESGSKLYKKQWIQYLFLMFFVTLSWNLFKLYNRGLI